MKPRSLSSLPLAGAVLLLAALLPSPAAAVELRDGAGDTEAAVAVSGEYRLQGTFLSDFAVDARGTAFGQDRVLDQRLRLGGELRAGPMRLQVEGDLFSGQIAGDTWDIPVGLDERHRDTLSATGADAFALRRASLLLGWQGVSLEAGLVTSHWGLGMVANDGAREPTFGRADFGDRVVRLRVTVRPLHLRADSAVKDALSITLAGDFVVADDLARLDRGQKAWQAVGSVAWARPGIDAYGLYAVLRRQVEADGDRETRLAVVDAYLDKTRQLAGGAVALRAAVEGAVVVGTTDRSRSYNGEDGLDVLAGGVAGLVQVRPKAFPLAGALRVGWASGDGDGDDGASNDFTFDRDFDVGSVLFDTVMAGVEAGTYALLTDGEFAGEPPDGVDAVLTEGSFRRAAFLQPVAEIQPASWLRVRVGLLAATATADFAQPFYTARAGGDPRNHLDQAPASRHLGTEVDWSVLVGGPLPPKRDPAPRFEILAQGGHLALGGALRGEGQEPWIHQVMLTGRARW